MVGQAPDDAPRATAENPADDRRNPRQLKPPPADAAIEVDSAVAHTTLGAAASLRWNAESVRKRFRIADPFEWHLTVRMMGHDAVALHRADTPSAANVETDADRALVQVGPAIGGARAETQHCHHRVTLEHDHPDIGHAADAPGIEHRMRVDQGFDDCRVRPTTQRMQTADDVGQQPLDVPEVHPLAAALDEVLPIPSDYDEDSAATAPLGGLDDELREISQLLVNGFDLVLMGKVVQQRWHPALAASVAW